MNSSQIVLQLGGVIIVLLYTWLICSGLYFIGRLLWILKNKFGSIVWRINETPSWNWYDLQDKVYKIHPKVELILATGCPLEEEEDFDEYIEIITEEITDILAKHLKGFKREKDYSLCNSSCSFSQFVSWY